MTPQPTHDGVRRRERTHRCRYKYVRRVGLMYQARVYLPLPVGSVNVGLYATESAAHLAVQAWLRSGADPRRGLPGGVLPKWVHADGDAFRWRVRLRGEWHGGGPFDTAAAAFDAGARFASRGRPASGCGAF